MHGSLTILKVDRAVFPHVLLENVFDVGEQVIQLLLDDGDKEETTEQDFLMLRRIRIIGRTFTGHQRVQLLQHENQ